MTEIEDIVDQICVAGPSGFRVHSANRIADFFREGESLRALVPMLTHPNPEIVSAGAWIASEVVDSFHGREVFDELSRLLSHPDPAVRFWPISCIAQLSTPTDTSALRQLLTLIADENVGVRNQALRYLCLIPSSTINGLEDSSFSSILRLLNLDASKVEILTEAKSTNALQRRAAIAGAIRRFRNDSVFIDELSRLLCPEERDELAGLRREMGKRTGGRDS